MAFVAGSIRASVPFLSVTSQMLSAPATIDPSELAMPIGNVFVTALVLRSMRESVESPQLGTHRLPNAAASPEHGPLPTVMVAATLFAAGSRRVTVSLGLFEIQTASST